VYQVLLFLLSELPGLAARHPPSVDALYLDYGLRNETKKAFAFFLDS
jgi:hypothetical protein